MPDVRRISCRTGGSAAERAAGSLASIAERSPLPYAVSVSLRFPLKEYSAIVAFDAPMFKVRNLMGLEIED